MVALLEPLTAAVSTGHYGSPEIEYLRDLVAGVRAHGHGRLRAVRFAALHPIQCLRAAALLARLPGLEARITTGAAGRAIGARRRRTLTVGGRRRAASALALPDTVAEYYRGKARQAVRTNLTNARKAGVRSRRLEEPAEQRALLDEIAASRGQEALPEWLRRNFGDAGMEYTVAEDRHGRLVGLCAAVVDAEVTLIAYHACVPGHPLRSAGRWLLTSRLIDDSIHRGARLLLVESGSLSLDEGLVYFQRRFGFRVYNLRLRRAG